jgi:tetratricopeptide (TPR) repeat protein
MYKVTIIFVLLYCLCCNVANAQSWDSLISISIEYLESNDTVQAIKYAEKAVLATEKEYSKNHENYGISLSHLGAIYQIIGQKERALPIYLNAIHNIDLTLGRSHLANGVNLMGIGFIYSDMGQYEKALTYYLEALENAETNLGISHHEYLTRYTSLGFLYLKMRQFEKALNIFEETLKHKERIFGRSHPEYEDIINIIAGINKDLGQFEKTKKIYLSELEYIEDYLGKNNLKYATNLKKLGGVYKDMAQFDNALSMYLKALEIIEKSVGKDHPEYAFTSTNLAGLYKSIGQYKNALPIYKNSLIIIEKVFGKQHSHYGMAINNLAVLYDEMGQYENALSLYLESLQITEKTFGKTHYEYGNSLANLAGLFESMGQYEKALPLYLSALEITQNKLGKEHPSYGTFQNNLGGLYQEMGEYEKALLVYLDALDITENFLGKEHPEYGTRLNNLAGCYTNMGQYLKAIPIYKAALENKQKVLGKNHPDYILILGNIASLYEKSGHYHTALPIYLEVLASTEKLKGKDHPDYGTIINNLAGLYDKMGQYEKALSLYLEAVENTVRALGKDHPAYGARLNNLAGLYKNMGEYKKALFMYQDALDKTEKSLGKEHPDYAIRLANLAGIYKEMGQYEKALPFYQNALEMTEKKLGKEHPSYGTLQNNLGGLFQEMGQYEKTLPLYLSALEITERLVRKDHPDYGNILYNLGLLYQEMGKYQNALTSIKDAVENTYHQINQNFIFLTDNEKELFYKTASFKFEIWQSFFKTYNIEKPDVATYAYDIELANKGMILQSGIQLRNAIFNSGDHKTVGLFDEWKSYKNILAKEYSKTIAERRVDLKDIEETTEKKEAELTRISSDFNNFKKIGQTKWKQIQDVLSINEVAIEFSSFRYRNNHNWTDSTLYVANILRKSDAHPQLVYLFEQKQIDSLLERNISKESSFINKIYADQKMYDLIWKPIEDYVNKGDHIYFAPSGILNQLNLGAISTSDSTYLSDDYIFHQVGSTAVLASSKKDEKVVEDIAIFGGIEFDAKEDEIAQVLAEVPKEHEYVTRGLYMTDAIRSGKWTYLDGTLQEAKNIDALAKESQTPTYLYSGTEAVEEHFKNLSCKKSPSVIHIATHGFFFPDPKSDKQKMNTISFQQENTFTLADNPLNRSGLLFAGGNKAWIGDTITTDREDGILTAYEVSNLSLFYTELVVLSACETGLGDIKGSEGVYGLQRAFKMAGARYLIMSLWKVPDIATKEFMTTFYTEYLTNQKPVREAFNVTQTKMKNKYRNEPYKWGGFVLME